MGDGHNGEEQVRGERARAVGLFRYSLIREAADPALSTKQRGRLVRALAGREGLIAVELVTQLGLKIGILTDGTDVAAMPTDQTSVGRARRSKVLRVLQIARERGLPAPQAFGVAEDDLLFALPVGSVGLVARDEVGRHGSALAGVGRRAVTARYEDSIEPAGYFSMPVDAAGAWLVSFKLLSFTRPLA